MTNVEWNEFLKLIPEFLNMLLMTCTHTMFLFDIIYHFLLHVANEFLGKSRVVLISVASSLAYPYPDRRCVHLFIHSEPSWQFRVYQGSRFYMLSPLFEESLHAMVVSLLILRWCGVLGYVCPYWDSRVTVLVFMADIAKIMSYLLTVTSGLA